VLTVALMSAVGGSWGTTAADAAIQNFTMSPTSGPAGTSVHVSGTGCAPGIVVSAGADYVQVSSTTLVPTNTQFAVGTNGSWNGVFVVPANAPAAPATVTAACFSDGLPSLQTIYRPQVFSVTAVSPTTVPTPSTTATTLVIGTTPTTRPHSGTTNPGSGSPAGGTPTSAGPSDPGSNPGDSVSTPGDTTGGVFDGGGGGPSKPGGSAATGANPDPSATASAKPAHGGADAARAADLSTPSLIAGGDRSSGGLGWLAWSLVILALLALLGVASWFYWTRRQEPAPNASPEPQ